MTPEVSCELASRWLSRAIDEEISSREESLLEGHLDTCPDCRKARDRLFEDVALIESQFAGITSELDELLGSDLAARAVDAPTPQPERQLPARWSFALAASTLFGVLLLVVLGRGEAPTSTVAVDYGAGIIRSIEGGEQHLAEAGSLEWQVGETLRLPSGSEAWFTFDDGSIARGGETSRWTLSEATGDEIEVELLAGRAAFRIVPREAPFRVLTPRAEITVLGTEFGVVHQQGRTIVTVTEGSVSVIRRNRRHEPYILEKDARLEINKRGILLDVHGRSNAGLAEEPPAPPVMVEEPPAAADPVEVAPPEPSEPQAPLDVPVGSG